jgi:hypothetical protein
MEDVGSRGRAAKQEEDRLRKEIEHIDTEHVRSPTNFNLIQDSIKGKIIARNKVISACEAAQTRLQTQRDNLAKEENRPDTSEEDLANIEEKRVRAARNREKTALALTVNLLLEKCNLLIRNLLKRQFL